MAAASRSSLAKNSIFNVLYQCVAVVCPLVISMYVSRVLMPEGVGLVASTNNFVSYFVTLAPLGMPAYGLREIAKTGSDGEKEDVLFSELFVLNVASSFVFLAIYLALFPLIGSQYDPRLYLVFSSLILMNCLNVDWFYQGREEYVYIALRSIGVKLSSLALVFLLVRDSGDVVAYAAILCFATAGNYIFNVARLHKYVYFRVKGIRPLRHLRSVLVLAGTVVLFSVFTKISVTLLGMICDEAQVGYYSNAYSASNIVLSLCTAVTGVFFPRFSAAFERDRAEFDRLVTGAFSVNLLISLPLAVGVTLVAEPAIGMLFGDAFLPAVPVLRVFSLLIVFKCLGNVIYQVCISTRMERGQLVSYTVGALVCTASCAALIPTFAAVGAAVATTLAELLVDVALVVYMHKVFRPRLSARFMASLAVSLIVMTVVVLGCLSFFEGSLVKIVTSFFLGGATYCGCGLLMGNELLCEGARRLRRMLG